MELALSGRYDFIDGFLFPSTCDVIRNLSGVWKVLFPHKYTHYLDVPQNFEKAIGGQYYERELRHLRKDLEGLSGRTISDDDLRSNRTLQRQSAGDRRAMGALKRSPVAGSGYGVLLDSVRRLSASG